MFSTKVEGNKTTLFLSDITSLDGVVQSLQLKNFFNECLREKTLKTLVVDLKGNDFLQSSIIGVLLFAAKIFPDKNKEFYLTNVDTNISNLFEMASIRTNFIIK